MSLHEFIELDKNMQIVEILERYSKLNLEGLEERELNHIHLIVAKAYFKKAQPSQASKLLEGVIEWSKGKDKELEIKASVLYANCCTMSGELQKSEKIFSELISSIEVPEKVDNFPQILMNFGICLFYQGDIVRAHDQFLKALEVGKERRIRYDNILNNLVLTSNYKGQYTMSISYATETLKLKEDYNDTPGWIIANVNLGTIYSYLQDFKKAHEHIDLALKVADEKVFKRELAGAYSGKGVIFIREKKEYEAYEELKKALFILEGSEVKDILPEILARLAYVSILLGYYEEAEKLIQKLEGIADKIQSKIYVIMSTILDTLLQYKYYNKVDSLAFLSNILDVTLEFQLYNLYFQTLFTSCYILVSEKMLDEVEIKLRNGLKVAEIQENILNRSKIIIALGYLYATIGRHKDIVQFEVDLNEISEKYQYHVTDIMNLGEFYFEMLELTNRDELENWRKKAYKHFVDYLQNINPWI